MKTEWDYSLLAKSYLKRPDYSTKTIERIFSKFNLKPNTCDIGAGCAHLTLMLSEKANNIIAVEPNDEMRKFGIDRTKEKSHISWLEAVGENTGLPNESFDLVTFGSSFNVTDRQKTLKEVHRILKPNGYVAVLWNHRDLTDSIQSNIEKIIEIHVPTYSYGTRREDQTKVIEQSGLYKAPIEKYEDTFIFQQKKEDLIEAWSSHATLQRQAGALFEEVISKIKNYVDSIKSEVIDIPYTSRLWIAEKT